MPISTVTPGQTTGDSASATNTDARYSGNNAHLVKRVLTAVTARQAALIAAIHKLRALTGRWPSGVKLAQAMRLNIGTVRRRLLRLRSLGVVHWDDGFVRIARQPDGIFLTMSEVRL